MLGYILGFVKKGFETHSMGFYCLLAFQPYIKPYQYLSKKKGNLQKSMYIQVITNIKKKKKIEYDSFCANSSKK